MKKLLAALAIGLFSASLGAQCSLLDLATFQDLQRADELAREAKILALGFDLHKERRTETAHIAMFRKCWTTTTASGQPIFGQFFRWDKTNNTLAYLTLDRAEADALRHAIEGRPTGVSTGDAYIGRVFAYRFFSEEIDGQTYFGTTIALKN